MAYNGSVELISGIKQKNNGTFPLVDASAVRVTDEKRLDSKLNDIASDINGKISEPSSEGTDGQVLATNGSGGRYWRTVSGGGGGGTSDYIDLTNKPQINGVTLTGNKSLADIGAVSYTEEELLRDEIPGTSTTVTMDSNGNPTSIVHTANSETVRTDTFVWGTGTVTETRTLANGKYITITTNLVTLAQTISDIQEVA